MSTYAWGSHNQFAPTKGSLGIGNGSLKPTTPTATLLPGGTVVKEVQTSSSTTFFLTTTGDIYGCGSNDSSIGEGCLGIGTTDSSAHATPVLITGLPAIDHIAAGANDQTWALTSTGDLYGWGCNRNGGLGLGHNSAVLSPTLCRTSVAKVSSSDRTTLVLDLDGTVHGAGLNVNGQLGKGTSTGPDPGNSYWNWTSTATGESVFDILSGSVRSWLVLNDGTVKATGVGPNGCLGYNVANAGGSVNSWTVVPHLSNIVQVTQDASVNAAYHLDSSGDIWFYGRNTSDGNAGTGSTTPFNRGTLVTDTPALVSMPVAAGSLCSGIAGTSGQFDGSMSAVGVDHLYYTWGMGTAGSGSSAAGFFQGSGADSLANPTPQSINGLTGVAYAALGSYCIFVVADITFASSSHSRGWAAVIG